MQMETGQNLGKVLGNTGTIIGGNGQMVELAKGMGYGTQFAMGMIPEVTREVRSLAHEAARDSMKKSASKPPQGPK